MVKIISSLLVIPIEEKKQAENTLNILNQEREVEKFLEKYKHQNLKVEWKQSSTTDGKNVFTSITAFIMTI